MLSNDEIAELYANNLYLKCVIVFRFLTSGAAIALLLSMELCRKKMLAHKSLVALMNFHALWTFVLCLSTFVDGAINVYTHLTMRISSDLLATGAQCLMRRVLAIVGVYGSVFSLFAMSVERYRASKKLSTYELTACGTKYVVFHLATVACLTTVHCLVYGTTWIIPHCVLVSREGENVIRIIVVVLVITEIVTITSFAKLLSKNIKTRKENSHNLTLSERYQLTENIRMLKLLLPIVLSHTSITIFGGICFGITELVNFGPEYYPMFEDSFNLVYMQGIVMPMIMLIRNRKERALEKQLISTNTPSNALAGFRIYLLFSMLSEQETAKLFASSVYLKILIIFRLTTSGIALVSMALFEMNRKKFVAHQSLRILMNFHGFWTFVLCLSTFVESILVAYTHLTLKNPIELLLSTNECLLRIIPTWAGIWERFEASRKLSTYESTTQRSGITLVLIHIVIILIVIVANGYVYEFPSRIAHCPTVSVLGKPVHSGVVAIAFFAELFTIFSYTKLLKRNEAIQASSKSMEMSLSERYQLFENIRVLRLLLPIVVFVCFPRPEMKFRVFSSHTSITIFGIAAYFYFEFGGFQPETYPIFEDTINLIYLQGIIMPLIFYCRHSYKRSMETRIFATNTSTGEVLATFHYGEITRGW